VSQLLSSVLVDWFDIYLSVYWRVDDSALRHR